ncbi:hypothetical protein PBI_THONKO_11 [Mycobacterium phage Thonko]|uniref:Uncharacterized protein n=1 Tax=Mycobacterium phage Thonko TaxID=2282910 RepID=A0A346FC58_9CAUD|nr:hypothetical protein I5G57_gp011 [Mycobacterium phage Thonko]AXN53283.1 hypothetical protein PBI_THONKO_11 [Mycobacterium phage Thonko]
MIEYIATALSADIAVTHYAGESFDAAVAELATVIGDAAREIDLDSPVVSLSPVEGMTYTRAAVEVGDTTYSIARVYRSI